MRGKTPIQIGSATSREDALVVENMGALDLIPRLGFAAKN
jgi:hypothetical protein